MQNLGTLRFIVIKRYVLILLIRTNFVLELRIWRIEGNEPKTNVQKELLGPFNKYYFPILSKK